MLYAEAKETTALLEEKAMMCFQVMQVTISFMEEMATTTFMAMREMIRNMGIAAMINLLDRVEILISYMGEPVTINFGA
jgi:hypothetical protein